MTIKEQLEIIEKECPLYKNGTSKRELRHDFFKVINTELQAYLLGFIMSDGSINKQRNTLAINIHSKDSEIFELFKIISPEAHVADQKGYESTALVRGHTVKNSGSTRLQIASVILINDLEKFGIVQNKTYTQMSIPTMREDLIKHFIRGCFDGDGCITYGVRKPNLKNREKNYRVAVRFDICAKTNNLLLEIQKWFSNKNIQINLNYIKRDDMYRVCTSAKKEVTKLFDLFYNNSNFYLSRKFNKFNYYVNTEVSQIITDHCNAQAMNDNESNNLPKSTEQPNWLKMCAEPSDD